jgi:nicotinate dehydrogenase subunit A
VAETFKLRVNGRDCEVRADPNTPLLYILRNDLKLKGARFGCGAGRCGACNVLLDGNAVPSCDTPLWSVPGHEITTVEGIGGAGPGGLHPVQQAFIDEQAIQCGYCIDGIIISAVALLRREKDPSDAQIAAALERNLCRCGTHVRIFRAIRSAARAMREQARA